MAGSATDQVAAALAGWLAAVTGASEDEAAQAADELAAEAADRVASGEFGGD